MDVCLRRFTVYLMHAAICCLIGRILGVLSIIQLLNYDLVPWFNTTSMLFAEIIVLIILLAWSSKDEYLTQTYSYLKHNRGLILALFYVVETVTYAKVIGKNKLMLGYMIVFFFYWSLLHLLFNKVFVYSFRDYDTKASYFSERPVVGKEFLTKAQYEALESLIRTIDTRKQIDSVNVALVGEWGTGKTSITNTFIRELQDRNSHDSLKPEYFILMINTQVMNNAKNIIEYINRYITVLFRQYGIILVNGQTNVEFLETMAEMIEGAKPISAFQGMLGRYKDEFIDVEQERSVFTRNVQELLSASGRKNIIFVIDNIDRMSSNESLLQMLSEFSSINGIITIISLDPQKDSFFQLTGRGKAGNSKSEKLEEYNELDKYIHVRIRMPEMDEVEYEKAVSEQIISAASIFCNGVGKAISVHGKYSFSMFSNTRIMDTYEINDHITKYTDDNSMLTDLFFLNFAKLSVSFGEYLEKIVEDHFCKSKELAKFIDFKQFDGSNEVNIKSVKTTAQWANIPNKPHMEWSSRLMTQTEKILMVFAMILKGLLKLHHNNDGKIESVKSKIRDYKDIYLFVINEGILEKSDEIDELNYEGLAEIEDLVLIPEEITSLNNLIKSREYGKSFELLKNRMDDVIGLFIFSLVLSDFLKYLRHCISNYRLFKMQLRECEILKVNYLDYLIRQWELSADATTKMNNMREATSTTYSKRWTEYLPLRDIINNVLYEKYILKYGENSIINELNGFEAQLMRKNEEEFIMIQKNDKTIIMNIDGTILSTE